MNKFELHSLLDIFDEGRRAFQIPNYQRGYSWEEKQVADLIKDLEHAAAVDTRHFGGTLVAVQSDCHENTFDIIDGQQRLTTLIILLRTLYDVENITTLNIDDRGTFDIKKTFILDDLNDGTKPRRLFTLNNETDKYFRDNILEDNTSPVTPRNKSHLNLFNAKKQFEVWLISKSKNECQKVLDTIINKFGFLFYAPDNTKETGLMFEVINNRGKRLSQLDKVKNYLLYYATKSDFDALGDKVNSEWGDNLQNLNDAGVISNEEENSFLRNCYLVFFRATKKDSYAVYDRLKEQFPAEESDAEKKKKINILIDFVGFLSKSTHAYRKLFTQDDVPCDDEKLELLRISLQPTIASVIPLILAVYSRVADGVQRTVLLSLIEKLNFRYYGSDIAPRADSGQGDLFLYANTFYGAYGETMEGKLIDSDWLAQKLIGFVEIHASDRSFVEALTLNKDKSGDYFHWKSLKFFLASYEYKLKLEGGKTENMRLLLNKKGKGKGNDRYEKEHLWALKETKYTDEDNGGKRPFNKRRLGNFVLLEPSLNSSVGNDPIHKKIDSFYRSDRKDIPHPKMVRELESIYKDAVSKADKINLEKIKKKNYWLNVISIFLDSREEKLVNFALDRWRMPSGGGINKIKISSIGKVNQVYKIL